MKKLIVLLVLVSLLVAPLPASADPPFPKTNCAVSTKWYSEIPDAVFSEQHWVLFTCDGEIGPATFMVPPAVWAEVSVGDEMVIQWEAGKVRWRQWTGISPLVHPLSPVDW